ncbi:MAG: hypothetical protein NTV70_11125 [Acidobacteria bacterium]|nr:hypothetical protein [Acidobacteriota bacterium]
MLVLETFVLICSLLALMLYSLGREYLRRRKDQHEGRQIDERLRLLTTLDQARRALGDPDEIINGLSGRQLYLWRQARPDGRLVNYSLTADASGKVTEASWKRTPTQ